MCLRLRWRRGRHRERGAPLALDAHAVDDLEVEPDGKAGFNVRIVPTNFTWAPENVNGDDVAGEGHAHLYLDGEQIDYDVRTIEADVLGEAQFLYWPARGWDRFGALK